MSPSSETESHRCNARKKGNGDLDKLEPGPHGGEGYCGQRAGWGTDHQAVFRDRVVEAGGDWHLVDSTDKLEDVLAGYGWEIELS